jgi:guanylate kinase
MSQATPRQPVSSGAGSVFAIVAPSGAGKTSLVRAMLQARPNLALSVSFTTRAPRPGEVDGVDYRFIDTDDFLRRRDAGEFLEWAQVHGNFYATSRTWIAERVAAGRDIVLEIDWQGAVQVQSLMPEVVGIFIAPPSVATLRERLVARGTDSAELAQAHRFEYLVVNEDFARALAELLGVVDASSLRFERQRARHPALFRDLFGEPDAPAVSS